MARGRRDGRALRRPRRRRRQRRHRPEAVRDRPRDLRRGVGAGLRGRPARRLAHGARGAAADRRAPGPDGRRLLRLRLRQRLRQQPLRGRQGRGRVARPLAAGGADAARRQRQRRLLRLGRHQAGPGRLRPGRRAERVQRTEPRVAAETDHARRGRRRRWCAGSKNGRRGSSRRSGGATSRALRGIAQPAARPAAWSANRDTRQLVARHRRRERRPRARSPAESADQRVSRSSRKTTDS